jgi:hypothetical protein
VQLGTALTVKELGCRGKHGGPYLSLTAVSTGDRMIYALKGDPGGFDILSFLRRGEGRFGWSYCSTADLHDLKSKIDASGWDSGLSAEEKDCYASCPILANTIT